MRLGRTDVIDLAQVRHVEGETPRWVSQKLAPLKDWKRKMRAAGARFAPQQRRLSAKAPAAEAKGSKVRDPDNKSTSGLRLERMSAMRAATGSIAGA